jgi:hypothetical protein
LSTPGQELFSSAIFAAASDSILLEVKNPGFCIKLFAQNLNQFPLPGVSNRHRP